MCTYISLTCHCSLIRCAPMSQALDTGRLLNAGWEPAGLLLVRVE